MIAFPQFTELDSLIYRYNVVNMGIDEELIKETTFEIRQTHVFFSEKSVQSSSKIVRARLFSFRHSSVTACTY